MNELLLRASQLSIGTTSATLVNGVSFDINRGEIVGVVGESGSGKTLTSLALAQLLPRGVQVSGGRIEFDGEDLAQLSAGARRTHLGTKLSMIFQDPMSSLNPSMRIGAQLIEGIVEHQRITRAAARARAMEVLGDVRITDPARVMRQYPHALSGGMRQRVMIALALMQEPELMIADEPTTALDVTVQAQVMEILSELNRAHGTAMLIVSHNIALLSEICDRVLVMFRGRLIDSLTIPELLAGKGEPYTNMLVQAVPDLGTDRSAPLATIDEVAWGGTLS